MGLIENAIKNGMTMEQQWRRLNGQRLIRPIEAEVAEVLQKEAAAGHELKVCIGTDSQVKGREIEFATVIVFLRRGRGGFMFIRQETVRRKMHIRERMLAEVSKSIETAFALSDLFARYNVAMEVHADINTSPAFRSNEALKEAMGYITGMGFAFRAKPQAFASSSCANKVVQ